MPFSGTDHFENSFSLVAEAGNLIEPGQAKVAVIGLGYVGLPLAVAFGSYLQPLIVMVAIPFGIVGAVIGHLLLGHDLSLISLMGVIALGIGNTVETKEWGIQSVILYLFIYTFVNIGAFGLVIVEKRRVDYSRIDPAEARRLFILEGLVRGELDSRAPFLLVPFLLA